MALPPDAPRIPLPAGAGKCTPEERFDYLLDKMADGFTHREMMRDPDECNLLPSKNAVVYRRRTDAAWNKRYDEAKIAYAHHQIGEIIEIADDRKSDPDPASRKVRIWARLMYAERMLGKVSDKIEHSVSTDFAELLAQRRSHVQKVLGENVVELKALPR